MYKQDTLPIPIGQYLPQIFGGEDEIRTHIFVLFAGCILNIEQMIGLEPITLNRF